MYNCIYILQSIDLYSTLFHLKINQKRPFDSFRFISMPFVHRHTASTFSPTTKSLAARGRGGASCVFLIFLYLSFYLYLSFILSSSDSFWLRFYKINRFHTQRPQDIQPSQAAFRDCHRNHSRFSRNSAWICGIGPVLKIDCLLAVCCRQRINGAKARKAVYVKLGCLCLDHLSLRCTYLTSIHSHSTKAGCKPWTFAANIFAQAGQLSAFTSIPEQTQSLRKKKVLMISLWFL